MNKKDEGSNPVEIALSTIFSFQSNIKSKIIALTVKLLTLNDSYIFLFIEKSVITLDKSALHDASWMNLNLEQVLL